MKARPRPILRAFYVAMFDRIEVNVIAMSEVVLLVTDSMLPITRLPHSAASLGVALLGYLPIAAAQREVRPRIERFCLPPSRGKTVIAVRQRPDAMKVI